MLRAIFLFSVSLAAWAQPILWTDPGDVTKLDVATGPGGESYRPAPPFHFVRESSGGTSPKIEVKDARGRVWRVKGGGEAHPEPVSVRLAWAVGFYAEPIHYVANGRIEGALGLKRAHKLVKPDGTFQNVVFEASEDEFTYMKDKGWTWTENPFVGTHELNGLKLMMILLSNWDNKDSRDETKTGSNVSVMKRPDGRLVYYVNDWGESLGSWGKHDLSRSRWNCGRYKGQSSQFITGVSDGRLQFSFSGHHVDDFSNDIRVEDARWLASYLGKLTDAQLQAAVQAGGASPEEVSCFSGEIRNRIRRLEAIASGK